MDPKTLSNLDPKMKETYERVMGTNTANPSNPTGTDVPPSNGMSVNATDPQPTNTFQTDNQQETTAQPFSSDLSSAPVESEPVPASTDSPFFTDTNPTESNPPTDDQSASSPELSSSLNSPVEPQSENNQTESQETNFTPGAPVTPYSDNEQSQSEFAAAGAAETVKPTASSFSQPFAAPANAQEETPHEASALLKVLYIVGAVVFFMIYTIFWIKVFKLPFLF